VSYTRWKAERAAWGTVSAGFSAVRLFLMLVMAPFVLIGVVASRDGAQPRQPHPRRDGIVGFGTFGIIFGALGGVCVYTGFSGVHTATKHPHALGGFGIALCGIAVLFLLGAVASAREGRNGER
jgi:hypothetical protein